MLDPLLPQKLEKLAIYIFISLLIIILIIVFNQVYVECTNHSTKEEIYE